MRLLYSAGYLYCDAMEACDVYTRQCSTLINTVELATLGATLAAGGVNPLTHKRVLQADNVPYILAEMMMGKGCMVAPVTGRIALVYRAKAV